MKKTLRFVGLVLVGLGSFGGTVWGNTFSRTYSSSGATYYTPAAGTHTCTLTDIGFAYKVDWYTGTYPNSVYRETDTDSYWPYGSASFEKTFSVGESTTISAVVYDSNGVEKKELNWVITIPKPASLYRTPSSLSFGETATSKSFSIKNNGGGTLSYSISKNQSWLSVSPTSGTASSETDSITVSINRSGMSPGIYSGTVTIDPNVGGNQTVVISMTVPDGEPSASRNTPASSAITLNYGASYTFKADGYDSGGDLAYADWTLSGAASDTDHDSFIDTTSKQSSYSRTFNTSGNYTLRCRFSDDDGDYDDATWSIYVRLEEPAKAASPSPDHKGTGVGPGADLDWGNAFRATSYKVYFGKSSNPSYTDTVSSSSWDPPGYMDYNTRYYWRVDTVNEGGTTTGDLWYFNTDPGSPVKVTTPVPANSSSNCPITQDLSWTGGGGATVGYKVYLGTSSTSLVLQDDVTGTSFALPNLSCDTDYYWRVDAHNGAGTYANGDVWHFKTIVEKPIKASNPLPAHQITGVGPAVDLDWDNAARAISYKVYFGTSSNPSLADTVTSSAWDPGIMQYNTRYYWRVSTVNEGGTTLGDLWYFDTDPGQPVKPTNPLPVNNATGCFIAQDLAWSSGGGATVDYSIYMGTSSGSLSLLKSENSTTSYALSDLAFNTDYYWRVDAHDGAGTYAIGDVWHFKTEPLPAAPSGVRMTEATDTAPEGAPSDLKADGITKNDQPNFSWNPVENATGYHWEIRTNPDQVLVASSDESGTTGSPSVDLADGEYNFSVMALFSVDNTTYCPNYSFLIDTEAPSVPDLLSPIHDGWVAGPTILYDWADSLDNLSEIYGYDLVEDKTDGLPAYDPFYVTSSTASSSYADDEYGSWKWKVCALDVAGNRSIYSVEWNFELKTDRYGLRIYDRGGLWPEIEEGNKLGLSDLSRTLTESLRDVYGDVIDSNDEKVLVFIHGWNRTGSTISPYLSENWGALVDTLLDKHFLPDDWTLVTYDWFNDAATGGWPAGEDPKQASEIAYQHGIAIGKKLQEQVGAENLKLVHVVSHSAGTWANYSLVRYLASEVPNIQGLQSTLLDPFIPGNTSDSVLDPFDNHYPSSLGSGYTKSIQDSYRADSYWSWDGSDWGPYTTEAAWDWVSIEDADAFRVDEWAADDRWDGHGGAILFYSDSVEGYADVRSGGWSKSLAYNDGNIRAPLTPIAFKPYAGTNSFTLMPILEWSSLVDGGDSDTQIGFEVRIRDSVTDDIVLSNYVSSTSANTYQISDGVLEWGKHYHWHVRYLDSGGQWSAWSADTPETHQDFYTVQPGTFVISSGHGSPVPATGSYSYTSGEEMQGGSVVSPVEESAGTRYRCFGYAGTGDAPSSGSGLSYPAFTINQDSTLIWNWIPQYEVTVSSGANGSVSPVSASWNDAGSDVEFTASPDSGYEVDVWEVSGSTAQQGNVSFTLFDLSEPSTVSVSFKEILGTTHSVIFDLGTHGTWIGGGALSQAISHGGDAVPPQFSIETGWTFDGWNGSLIGIIADVTIVAQYVAVSEDSDGDGMDDNWETLHFGDLSQDADGDFDKDGRTNVEEHGDGTDPVDAGSTLGLMAYYPCNGDLVDATGNGFDGIAHGGVLYGIDRFGVDGSTFDLNGVDGFGKATSTTSMLGENPDEWSYSCWFRSDDWSKDPVILSDYDSDAWDNNFGISISENSPDAEIDVSVRSSAIGYNPVAPTIAEGEWHQVTVSASKPNAELQLFVDGKLHSSCSISGTADYFDGSPLYFGINRFQGQYDRFFDGALDDVRIYNRVLSSNEVLRLYGDGATVPASYPLAVESGSGDGSYTNGAIIDIIADAAPTGQVFTGWSVVPFAFSVNISDTNSASTTFLMPGTNVMLTATYQDVLFPKVYGGFALTTDRYLDSSDWAVAIDNELGGAYRVADWNDLVACHNGGGDLIALYDALGLTNYNQSASVTRSGDPSYSSTRYYFASRHEHSKPGNYMAHANIDSYLISLGSWSGSRKILSIRNDFDPAEPMRNAIFNLGEHGTHVGGGSLSQQVAFGESAQVPWIKVAQGWIIDGWDTAFSSVTNNLTVTAQYTSLALFEDTFENLDNWTLWGSPTPAIYVKDGNPAFNNRGDGMWDSGAVSKQSFDYSNGLVIEADAFQNQFGNWQSFTMGLSKKTSYGSSEGVQMSVGIRAAHDRGDTTQCYITYAGDQRETFELYDNNTTSWRHYRIVIRNDRKVEFYRGSELLYVTTNQLDLAYNNMPIVLGSRAYYSPVLIDNVRVVGVEDSAVDVDGDNVPDVWEKRYFGGIDVADAMVDADGDGHSNLDEYIAGMNPVDKDSCFKVAVVKAPLGGFSVNWDSVPDRVYDVLWTPSLNRGFQILETGLKYPIKSFIDTEYATRSSGYYMVAVRLPGNGDSDGDGLPDS